MSPRRKCLWIVLAALAIRLVVMAFLYQQQLDPTQDHWSFGYEEGRIARSIAAGKGFASPLYADTGPSAWSAPVYPYFLAGVFKIFGTFTEASALVILSLQCLFSALTAVPIFAFARKTFGEQVATWSGWAWVVFPWAVYLPVVRIWDTWLTTLLFGILFWMALEMAERVHWKTWISFGLLSGFAALTSPTVLMVLPFLGLWVCWQQQRMGQKWILQAAGTALAVILVLSPWMIRNYRTFHVFLAMRDDFGLVLRVGNSGDSSDIRDVHAGPWNNPVEWEEFQRLGELRYMDLKKQQAFAYVGSHKAEYAWLTFRRIVNVWTCFWSFGRAYLQENPFDPLIIILCSALSALTLYGLWLAFRNRVEFAVPYALVLLLFPLIYYLTDVLDYYRRPIDPFFVVLAAYGVVSYFRRPRADATQAS